MGVRGRLSLVCGLRLLGVLGAEFCEVCARFASLGRPRRPSLRGPYQACSFRDGAKVFAYGSGRWGGRAQELSSSGANL